MKHWQIACATLTLFVIPGCRINPNIAILERELRRQEDEIYRLRDCIRDMQEAGQPCGSSATAGTNSPDSQRGESASPQRSNATIGSGDAGPLKIEMPSRPSSVVPDSLKPPPGSAPLDIPKDRESSEAPSHGGGSGLIGPSLGGGDKDFSARPMEDSRLTASIALDRSLTGGIPGTDGGRDSGLLVVVEPRDANGRVIAAPAEMVVVLLDSALRDEDGMAACVARWEFSASQTASMWRRRGPEGAIHLTLTWPDAPPQHDQLHLFVRYITRDGRNLEANQPIELARSGATASKPHDHRANGPAATQAAASSRPGRPVWTPQRR